MPTTKQRRETARRRLERQIQRRQEAAVKRRRRNLVTAAALGVVLVLGGVFLLVTQLGDDEPTAPAAAPTPTATAAAPGECTFTKGQEPAARDVGAPPSGKVPTTGKVTVNMATNRGPITLTLDRAKAPCAVASFTHLASSKYFDGTPCHRLTTGAGLRVLQCGDPSGTGGGGPGYTFADEVTPDLKYRKGVLAMANSGADTNGSQFFLVYADSHLPPRYTVFGQVTRGLDIVEKVAKAGSDNSQGDGDGKPKQPVTITSVRVV